MACTGIFTVKRNESIVTELFDEGQSQQAASSAEKEWNNLNIQGFQRQDAKHMKMPADMRYVKVTIFTTKGN